jgi:glutaminyl-peptide cyclotransferase
VALPAGEFGEGLALVGERLVQLTWHEGLARVWRRDDFALLATWRYEGEGWGLAFDGRELVQSDGSATLTFRSADDFSPRRTLEVRRAGRAQAYLNELEWAEGALYANVWQSDEIVRIDPASGEVRAVFDASGLLPAELRATTDVLNGIAYDPERRRFFLTGKLWPQLFEVELVAPSD